MYASANSKTLNYPDTDNNDYKQYIAYNHLSVNDNKDILVIFLGGFMSNMQGSKAVYLQKYCEQNNIDYLRFDYRGHGESSGDIADFSIGDWLEDVFYVVNNLAYNKRVILVGSSLGGWLSLLAARDFTKKCNTKNNNKLAGLITIAAAPDFTEKLIWQAFSLQERMEILKKGKLIMPSEYCNQPNQEEKIEFVISKKLIEGGREFLLLDDNDEIKINVPTILLHGDADEDVPFNFSLKIQQKLSTKNAKVIISNGSGHRFSSEGDLQLLTNSLEEILQQIYS